MTNKNLIVVVGPTAIGKTNFSIQLAKALNTEIISVDSRQFFKEMTIGTAVPSKVELASAKHHFIHSHSVEEEFNAGKFEIEALKAITELFETHDNLILTGGSGLYIDALCNGIDEMAGDKAIKQELIDLHKEEGLYPLILQLRELDPEYYEKVDRKNAVRVIRALEVCLATGEPFSSLRKKEPKQRDFNIIKVGLDADRETIYERINQRVDKMMEAGLLDEVKSLVDKKHLNALQTVGYREMFEFLEEKTTLEKATDEVKKNSRRYAKRQLTWFKKDEQTKWFDFKDVDSAEQHILSCVNS